MKELGIIITQDPASATHLVSPHIVRTQKFACAMARGPTVLSTNFIDQCLLQGTRLRPEDYLLKDANGEQRLGFKITDATAKAKANKGRLLHGYTIYCTENIRGGFDSYKSIAEANGSTCRLFRARVGSTITSRAGGSDETDDEEEEEEYVYLVSGASPEEKKVWPKFRTMVHGAGKVPKVVRSDWMLDLALRQEVRWLDGYELVDGEVET